MAISDRIRAEAQRTIDGMQRFYEKFSDDADDAEELEHRIARVESAMAGCNGLSQDDKIQKTAENLFELTCAQERSYDSLRRELKRVRDEHKQEFAEMKEMNSKDFGNLQKELRKGLDSVMKKIEDSGSDCSAPSKGSADMPYVWKLISDHPIMAFSTFMFILILVFVSGHFDVLEKALHISGGAT